MEKTGGKTTSTFCQPCWALVFHCGHIKDNLGCQVLASLLVRLLLPHCREFLTNRLSQHLPHITRGMRLIVDLQENAASLHRWVAMVLVLLRLLFVHFKEADVLSELEQLGTLPEPFWPAPAECSLTEKSSTDRRPTEVQKPVVWCSSLMWPSSSLLFW